jgi:Rad3-related DNA helicase
MYCTNCHWEYPYDTEYLSSPCVSCAGTIITSAEDWLEHTELGLAKEVRPNQIKLTNQIRNTYHHGGVLIAEAGTGIGKSFAYLLPAMIDTSRRIIVTTAKKALQQQLFHKDIPALEKTLNRKLETVLLYGRSNYACKRLWYQNKEELQIDDRFIDNFFKWSTEGLTDDLETFYKTKGPKPKRLKVLQPKLAALNAGDCSIRTTRCAYKNECPYLLNRSRVNKADIIVTNHWMVGYDLLTAIDNKDANIFTKPDRGLVLVVDEAHKFEDAVRNALTIELKKSTLHKHLDALKVFVSLDTWHAVSGALHDLVEAWKDLFTQANANRNLKLSAQEPLLLKVIHSAEVLRTGLNSIPAIEAYITAAEPDKDKHALLETSMLRSLADAMNPAPKAGTVSTTTTSTDTQISAINAYTNFVIFLQTIIAFAVVEDNQVCYIDNENGFVSIKEAPVDLNMFIRPYLKDKYDAAVFLSATLAVNYSFNYFARRMGISPTIPSVTCAQYPTEFDYSTQAVLYVNNKLPAPQVGNMENYYRALTIEVANLLNASKGNAFILFTARDDLSYVTNSIRPLLQDVTVFSQTEVTARQALEQFNTTPNSALMGLKTFWEGIDIPGDKLRLVVITKLPFPNSKDPIIDARCTKADDRAFIDVLLPEMISDLRQGVGRLIRSKTDRGVIAILDSRLLTKSYKNAVLNSLGINKVITDTSRVLRNLEFLASQP